MARRTTEGPLTRTRASKLVNRNSTYIIDMHFNVRRTGAGRQRYSSLDVDLALLTEKGYVLRDLCLILQGVTGPDSADEGLLAAEDI